jgi:hypothetical protein
MKAGGCNAAWAMLEMIVLVLDGMMVGEEAKIARQRLLGILSHICSWVLTATCSKESKFLAFMS